VLALLFVVAATAPRVAQASGFLVPIRGEVLEEGAWSVEEMRISAIVRGEHALVTVEQIFRNHTPRTLEMSCWLPILRDGIQGVAALVDGEPGGGRTLRGSEADAFVLEGLRRRRDPRLLEHLGYDLHHVPELALPPNGRSRVTLKFEQEVRPLRGVQDLHIPLRAARPRGEGRSGLRVEIDIAGATANSAERIGPIYSPHHDLQVERTGTDRVRVRYEGVLDPTEPDLRLFWSRTRSPVGITMLSCWPEEEERGYYMLLAEARSATVVQAPRRMRSLLFLVDSSASMSGERLDQVRRGILGILMRLSPRDRFNIIACGATPQALFPETKPTTPDAQRAARGFLEDLEVGGAVDLGAALRRALASGVPSEGTLTMLVALDGRPTPDLDDTTLDALLEPHGNGLRIHTVGIGVDADAHVLEQLARRTGGRATWMPPRADLEVGLLERATELVTPALPRPRLEIEEGDITQLLPKRLPDLVPGRTLVATGRYRRAGRPEVVLRDQSRSFGREFGAVSWLASRGDMSQGDAPLRVWSRRRQAAIIDAVRLDKDDDQDRIAELVSLSTKLGLLTEYTHWLADEHSDHTEFAANTERCFRTLSQYRAEHSGALAVAQSANQAGRRSATHVPFRPQIAWLPAAGERDILRVRWPGVRRAGGRTFYYRRRLGWVDAGIESLASVEDEIPRWSDAFFALLEKTTPSENACLALRGSLLLGLGGRVLRIVEGS
jgi:Ca-activated chloride channel family protein